MKNSKRLIFWTIKSWYQCTSIKINVNVAMKGRRKKETRLKEIGNEIEVSEEVLEVKLTEKIVKMVEPGERTGVVDDDCY